MKKFLKYSLLAAAILANVISVKAASLTAYCTAQTTNGVNVFSNGVVIYKMTFANTNGAGPNYVVMVDTATTNVNYTLGAYTNSVLTATNQISNFTNIVGGVENFTNTYYFMSNSVVAAAYQQKPVIFTTTLGAGTNNSVYNPQYPIIAPSGVTVTNIYGLSITFDYANLR